MVKGHHLLGYGKGSSLLLGYGKGSSLLLGYGKGSEEVGTGLALT